MVLHGIQFLSARHGIVLEEVSVILPKAHFRILEGEGSWVDNFSFPQ